MPRQREVAKVKDFKGTLLRMFKSLKSWKYILVLSCILSMIAAILSTIAPNKLADVTDVISEGIKPNTEKFEYVSGVIFKNLSISYSSEDPNKLLVEFNKLDKEKR